MRRFGSNRWLAGGLLALICWAGGEPASAQSVSEQSVKAGFIYNFVKFTQWPSAREGDRSPLQVCTPGSQPLDGQFALLQGRTIGSRSIDIRSNAPASEWRNCQVLFLAETDAHRVESVLRSLGSAPVLALGDVPDFAQSGGMIGLKIEDSRVRFDVNLGAAQRAGLTLNSQMLKLAGHVVR